jgi:tetratricopeptide (TPR) repeat protein
MDSLITAAARALAAGDPLGALKRVALREDPTALALRGIAMAQLGELQRAKQLLRSAARAFGPEEQTSRARCLVAEAEVALVSRDISGSTEPLGAARRTLQSHGDRANAAHAGYLMARRLLLIGRIDEAEAMLDDIDVEVMPKASRAGFWLVALGIAMRRVRAKAAHAALGAAQTAAAEARIPAVSAEVGRAEAALLAPAARQIGPEGSRLLALGDVEELIASNGLIADACREVVRSGPTIVPLAGRPVLFALARALAEVWPAELSREALILRAFRGRDADESHRARLRVEIGRLRKAIQPIGAVSATKRGFVLKTLDGRRVAVIAPPIEEEHSHLLALLADGAAWSSSALALALGVSARTVQRALEDLARAGKIEAVGRGRARRWMAQTVPGFPTSLLLPVSPALG